MSGCGMRLRGGSDQSASSMIGRPHGVLERSLDLLQQFSALLLHRQQADNWVLSGKFDGKRLQGVDLAANYEDKPGRIFESGPYIDVMVVEFAVIRVVLLHRYSLLLGQRLS